MKNSSHLFILVFFLTSCASKVVQETPNFKLQGKAAQAEYKKFKLDQVSVYGGRFSSEGFFTGADSEQLRPLIEQVKPKSIQMLKKTKKQERLWWTLWATWIVTIFIKDSDGYPSKAYWWSGAVVIGYSIYLEQDREKIRQQYNKDLRSKFNPTLSYNFLF